MNPSLSLSDTPSPRGRGRWQLLGLLALVLGPMLLASAMYRWQFWVPEGRSFHGELLGDGRDRAALGIAEAATPAAAAAPVAASEVDAPGDRWQVLVTSPDDCAEACRRLVYLARQIHIGLGREASRGEHALASATAPTADYQATLARDYPRLRRYDLDAGRYRGAVPGGEPALWIVDPHGNLVLRYPAGVNGKAVLDDLRHLLKLSKIG